MASRPALQPHLARDGSEPAERDARGGQHDVALPGAVLGVRRGADGERHRHDGGGDGDDHRRVHARHHIGQAG